MYPSSQPSTVCSAEVYEYKHRQRFARPTGKHLHDSAFHCQVTGVRVFGQHFRHPNLFAGFVNGTELERMSAPFDELEAELTLLL